MMKIWIYVLSSLLLFGATSVLAKDSQAVSEQERLASMIERKATTSYNIETFGKRIIQNLYKDVSKQVREGKRGTFKHTIVFKTTLWYTPKPDGTPPLPPMAGLPSKLPDVDICAEMCAGELGCYSDCAAPQLENRPLSPCKLQWNEYEEATDPAEKTLLMCGMIENRCISPEEVNIEVKR